MIIDKKGFTLTELIGAVLIITIMSAGMFGAFIGAQYVFGRGRHRMQAFSFAREAQDKLKSNYSYDDSEMEPRGHTEVEIGDDIVRGDMDTLGATLTYDVSEPQPGGYKEVKVSVTWNEPTL